MTLTEENAATPTELASHIPLRERQWQGVNSESIQRVAKKKEAAKDGKKNLNLSPR
jgi:hypothetical protein